MVKPYKAAFLIPASANKVLEDTGWFFETPDRLPPNITETVVRDLLLEFNEEYDDVIVYVGNGIKASIFKDDKGFVEQIYFQLTNKNVEELKRSLSCIKFVNVELFVP